MKIILQKLPGRNLSTKASLDSIRGTIEADDGTVILASANKLKIVDITNLEKKEIATFEHLKKETKRKKGNKVYAERLVKHTIYEIELFGVPMLFEQIDNEPSAITFNNALPRVKKLNIEGNCFKRLTFNEIGNVATGDLDEVIRKELELNKPKYTKSKKTISLKVKKLAVEIKITYR